MGKIKQNKRGVIKRGSESSKSYFRRNRMVLISFIFIAIVAVSIYFGVSASSNEKNKVKNITNSEPALTVTPKLTTPPDTIKTPTETPTPKPTVEQDSNPEPKPSGKIKAKWIDPQIADDIISIPVSEVQNSLNIHFGIETTSEKINFMAYMLDDEIHVRANICPPCRSIGFSLQKDILVCDRCNTTFEAKTGNGIKGACVDYPKAAVPYDITDGLILMSMDDLKTAIQETIIPG